MGTKTLLPDIPRYHGDVQLIVAARGCGEVVRADRWSFATLCRKCAECPVNIRGQVRGPITILQCPLDIEWRCDVNARVARTLLADMEESCRRSYFLRVSEDAAHLGDTRNIMQTSFQVSQGPTGDPSLRGHPNRYSCTTIDIPEHRRVDLSISRYP